MSDDDDDGEGAKKAVRLKTSALDPAHAMALEVGRLVL